MMPGVGACASAASTGPVTPFPDAAEAMARRSIHWIIVGCLTGRLLTPFTHLGPALLLDGDPSRWAVRFAAVVAVIDVVLLVGVSLGRFRWVVTAWWFLVLDIALAVGINLFVATLIPHGTFWQQGHDPLGAYLAGTMAVWAVIRGPCLGGALLTGYAAVVAAEAWWNGAPFDALGWLAYGELVVWALISMTAGLSVTVLARESARRAAAVVVEDTHARAMAKLHGSVVQVLAQIGSLSRRDAPPRQLLNTIHALAAEQAAAAAAGAAELGLAAHEDLRTVVTRACRARPAVEVDLATEPVFDETRVARPR